MTQEQSELLSMLEAAVARMHHGGYERVAAAVGAVVDSLHAGDTVWAVVLASASADAGDLGPAFVERLRLAFGVGRIE